MHRAMHRRLVAVGSLVALATQVLVDPVEATNAGDLFISEYVEGSSADDSVAEHAVARPLNRSTLRAS